MASLDDNVNDTELAAADTDRRGLEESKEEPKFKLACNKCRIRFAERGGNEPDDPVADLLHCVDCQVCVVDCDHHCPFFGKCIASGNLSAFYQSICCVVVNTVAVAFAAAAPS